MHHSVTGYTTVQALQIVAVLGKNSVNFTDLWFEHFLLVEQNEGLLKSWILDVFDVDAIGIAQTRNQFHNETARMKIKTERFGVMS